MTEEHTHLWASLKQFCDQQERQFAEISDPVSKLFERQDGLEEDVTRLSEHVMQLSERVGRLSVLIESLLNSQDSGELGWAEQPAPGEKNVPGEGRGHRLIDPSKGV